MLVGGVIMLAAMSASDTLRAYPSRQCTSPIAARPPYLVTPRAASSDPPPAAPIARIEILASYRIAELVGLSSVGETENLVAAGIIADVMASPTQ